MLDIAGSVLRTSAPMPVKRAPTSGAEEIADTGNIILSRYLGAAGIALATTITVTLGTIIYGLFLRRYFHTEDRATPTYPLWGEILKTLMATIPVGLIAWLGLKWIAPVTAFIPLLLHTMAVCAVAVLAYAVCSIALRLDGWQTIVDRFKGLALRLRSR
jgi:putative peptidoglycan lipid II flippase